MRHKTKNKRIRYVLLYLVYHRSERETCTLTVRGHSVGLSVLFVYVAVVVSASVLEGLVGSCFSLLLFVCLFLPLCDFAFFLLVPPLCLFFLFSLHCFSPSAPPHHTHTTHHTPHTCDFLEMRGWRGCAARMRNAKRIEGMRQV